MGPQHGSFCWMELNAAETKPAESFYSDLLGWKMVQSTIPDMEYTEFSLDGEAPIGGMFKMPPEMGEVPAHWMAYVAVDDVDASAAKVAELGGKVEREPMDIPGVGRFCIITDPTGAHLALITVAMSDEHKG